MNQIFKEVEAMQKGEVWICQLDFLSETVETKISMEQDSNFWMSLNSLQTEKEWL